MEVKMPRARNPFRYGGRVSGDHFCDREEEIGELLTDVRSHQHVVLYSQRRFGKTSLVWKLMEEARSGDIIPVYVDLYPISTLRELIEEYAKAIARALSRYEKAKKLMRELFTRLYLSMGVDASGNPTWSVGFDKDRETDSFEEVASCMEEYLGKKGKTGVVVFDEFQQIVETNGERTERRLRSMIQTHEHVSYVFVGSKKHLLRDLFTNPNRPFYRSAKIFPLGKIPSPELSKFIMERFEEAKVGIDDEAVVAVLEATECHPYYTQCLCHALFELRRGGRIRAGDVPRAVDLLIERESAAYMNTWDLLTQRQRQALVSLSETAPEESPYRPEMLRRFDISQPSVMIRALKSLVDKDLIDREGGRYEIIDLFFKRWIKTYISQSKPA
jgi:hypothetical protein